MHLVRFFDEFVPEIGVCQADEGFCALPGRFTHEVDHAVFCRNPVRLGTGIGDSRTGFQDGADVGRNRTGLFIRMGRVHGDDGLTASGPVGTVGEVQLAAAATDLVGPHGFGRYLAIEVYFDAAVDGNEIIELADC